MTQAALALDTRTETEDLCERVRAVAKAKLAPAIDAIDKGELYPEDILRAFGAEGAFASHMPMNGDGRSAAGDRGDVGDRRRPAAPPRFMAWCQDTLAWYVGNSAECRAEGAVAVARCRAARNSAAPACRTR